MDWLTETKRTVRKAHLTVVSNTEKRLTAK